MLIREKLRKRAETQAKSHKHVHLKIHAVAICSKTSAASTENRIFRDPGDMRRKSWGVFCLTCKGVERGASPIPFLKSKGGNVGRPAIFFYALPDKFVCWLGVCAKKKTGRGFFL